MTELTHVTVIAESVSALLGRHAEVVLHDLSTGKILRIWNRFSGRDAGDQSMIQRPFDSDNCSGDSIGPYPKRETDGRLIKSVTSVLRDPRSGDPMALLCINLDVSAFEGALDTIRDFLPAENIQPGHLVNSDWRELINFTFHEWMRKNNMAEVAMSRSDKVALVAHLDNHGAFAVRKSIDHICTLLKTSRGSIYNYLKESRLRKNPKGNQ